MEAQSEYAQVGYMFFARLSAELYAWSVLVNKISASELSRKFVKRVRCWLGRLISLNLSLTVERNVR